MPFHQRPATFSLHQALIAPVKSSAFSRPLSARLNSWDIVIVSCSFVNESMGQIIFIHEDRTLPDIRCECAPLTSFQSKGLITIVIAPRFQSIQSGPTLVARGQNEDRRAASALARSLLEKLQPVTIGQVQVQKAHVNTSSVCSARSALVSVENSSTMCRSASRAP